MQTMQEVTQGLATMKTHARSIENAAQSFVVLTDNPDTVALLNSIGERASKMALDIQAIYADVARIAMRVPR